MESKEGHVIGIPLSSHPPTPEHVSMYIHCTLFGFSKIKQRKVKSLSNWMSKFTSKADSFAQGIRDHVNFGSKISETVKSKLSLGTRILQAGGVQKVFRQSFSSRKGEKLLKAFQCYLSTTGGPIAGLLFVSNKKIAFLSNRTLPVASDGKEMRIPYKVAIPLRRIKSTNQTANVERPSQKFLQIVTVDDFEFWFMGRDINLQSKQAPWLFD
ncbi:hypothetical protein HPP92_014759 [Vanilla planifolia]|uniref:GRAM domain-containing protein n=1 Tax=Vanilla planifolia TaxID=51239 RepID=A0A835QS88_VANPL|nr:hypothetical protein HPP92_014759 [Vanilla planifolia]